MALKKTILISSILLLATGCGVEVKEAAPTSTALPLTATLPAAPSPAPSDTPLPPPPQPTAAPVEGTSLTQVNVRSEPSTSANVLGIIPPNTKVQILGKDPGGNWWQILYEPGVEGKGWVTAKYVTAANADDILVIGGDGSDPNNENVAVVQQQINVRSGPGTGFNSLGTLNAQDVVSLTGKDANGAWLQISYSTGPEGKGWINAAFVQARGAENLPIISDSGQVVGTGTPTGIPFTPTPTVLPAWADHDSQNNPVAGVLFEPGGTHMLIYSGDISSPEGDSEDWINFKPYTETITASLACTGGNSLRTELFENAVPVNLEVACGEVAKRIDVKSGSTYLLRVYTSPSSSTFEYIAYTIKIETSP